MINIDETIQNVGLVIFLLQVVSNVFQNDNVRVRADVKSLVPLENVGQCMYEIISSCFLS